MFSKRVKQFCKQIRPVGEGHWEGGHRHRSLSGAGSIQVAEKILLGGLSFLSAVCLSRILDAEVFGLIALVVFFQNLLMTMGSGGFTESIVQVKELNALKLNGVFMVNGLVGVCFGALLAVGGPLIASFYSEPTLLPICIVFGILFVFRNSSQVHLGILQRHMKSELNAIVSILPQGLSFAVSVLGAIYGYGVWSLVGGITVSVLFRQILLWYFVKWRPSLVSFPIGEVRGMLKYGLIANLTRLVGFLSSNMQTVILGKFAGPSDVGYFNRAETIYQRPLAQFAWPLGRLFMPRMSSHQDDPCKLLHFINISTWFMSYFLLPFAITMMVCGDWVIVILLGEKWMASGDITRWLALSQLPTMLSICLVRGNAAIGRPGRALYLNIVMLGTICCGLVYFAPIGLILVVQFLAAVRIAFYPIFVFLNLKGSGFIWKDYIFPIIQLIGFVVILTGFFLVVRSHYAPATLIGKIAFCCSVTMLSFVLLYLVFLVTKTGSIVIGLILKRLRRFSFS